MFEIPRAGIFRARNGSKLVGTKWGKGSGHDVSRPPTAISKIGQCSRKDMGTMKKIMGFVMILGVAGLLGCAEAKKPVKESMDKAAEAAKEAGDKAAEAGHKAVEAGEKAVEAGEHAAGAAAEAAKGAATDAADAAKGAVDGAKGAVEGEPK